MTSQNYTMPTTDIRWALTCPEMDREMIALALVILLVGFCYVLWHTYHTEPTNIDELEAVYQAHLARLADVREQKWHQLQAAGGEAIRHGEKVNQIEIVEVGRWWND